MQFNLQVNNTTLYALSNAIQNSNYFCLNSKKYIIFDLFDLDQFFCLEGTHVLPYNLIHRDANPRGRVPLWYIDIASYLSTIPISNLYTEIRL
jgi:hypothetical protein